MIILDTNVISELLRPVPDVNVLSWLGGLDGETVYITAITGAELLFGVEIMHDSRRRNDLAVAIEGILRDDFEGRILAFDSASAMAYAEIAARRRSSGRPISQFDCQIAAIASVQAATVATRNDADFEGCGIDVINPWLVRS